jgi:hypothetical protein
MLTITLALAIALAAGLIVVPAAEAIQLLQDSDNNNTLEQLHHKEKHQKKFRR